jgi:lipoprotein-releasing system permease protein
VPPGRISLPAMSKLPFELLLALRYLRPKRSFVSIITLISIIGVALGVAVLIIVISVMSGFDHDLRNTILGFNPHLKVSRAGVAMDDYPVVAKSIAADPDVVGVSPFVCGPVVVQTGADSGHEAVADTPTLLGVDPASEGKINDLKGKIIDGKFDLHGRGLVVGCDFAYNLHLRVGDTLSVYSPGEIKKMKTDYDKHEQSAVLPDDYVVRGIFDAGYYEYDSRYIVSSLDNAQDLYGLNDAVHGLFVTVKDPDQATAVKQRLEQRLGPDFNLVTWLDENSNFLNAIKVEKTMMFFIMFFIVIVAAFGITCTLITFVVMKTREIGLLKAVGASNRQVMLVFVIQSIIVSVFGVASGTTLGLFAIYIRNDFLHFMNHLTGFELFPASIYGFSELPALVNPGDIAIICGGSLLICLLAAILPARHASKMNIVEALHHE